MFIRFLLTLILFSFYSSSCLSMDSADRLEKASKTTCPRVEHIRELHDDALAYVLVSAADPTTLPKTLSLVSRKWAGLVHNKEVNRQLARRSRGIFRIDLSSFSSKDEALAYLDEQVPFHVNALGLEIVESTPGKSPLAVSDIFPSRFLKFKNLRLLAIKGNHHLNITPFANGMLHGADPSKLPAFHLLKDLREIDVPYVSGDEGMLVANFGGALLPRLPHLVKVAMGLIDQDAAFFLRGIRFKKNVKHVTVYRTMSNCWLKSRKKSHLHEGHKYTHLFNPKLGNTTLIRVGVYSYDRLLGLGWASNPNNPHDKYTHYFLMELLNKNWELPEGLVKKSKSKSHASS